MIILHRSKALTDLGIDDGTDVSVTGNCFQGAEVGVRVYSVFDTAQLNAELNDFADTDYGVYYSGLGGAAGCDPSGDGDECTTPIVVGEGTFAGDTSDNTGSTGDDTSCAYNDTIDEWYCYTPTADGLATASTCIAPGFDTTLAVFLGCVGELACDDYDPCGSWAAEIDWPVVAGTSYLIRVAGYNNAQGTYTLEITHDPTFPLPDVNPIGAPDNWWGDVSGPDTGGSATYGDVEADTWLLSPPGVCGCPGDLDGDGDIDIGDLAQLLAHYGMTEGATYEDGDLDGDGDVDIADLAALLAVYGTTC